MNELDGKSEAEHNREEPALPPVVFGPIEIEEDPIEETPRPLPLPYRQRHNPYGYEPSSRELLLGWCLWLLCSWSLLGMGIDGTPIRWMIFASAMGMMIIWPAYRLSQSGMRSFTFSESMVSRDELLSAPVQDLSHLLPPAAASVSYASVDAVAPQVKVLPSHLTPGLIFRDWFALNGVFQAVIWPHLLTGQWSFEQAGWVSASMATWSLLIAAIVAWGCRSLAGLRRTAAMLLVMLLLFGEPLILALANELADRWQQSGLDWPMSISPIEAIYALTAPPLDYSPGQWRITVLCVLVVAVMSWVGLWVKGRRA